MSKSIRTKPQQCWGRQTDSRLVWVSEVVTEEGPKRIPLFPGSTPKTLLTFHSTYSPSTAPTHPGLVLRPPRTPTRPPAPTPGAGPGPPPGKTPHSPSPRSRWGRGPGREPPRPGPGSLRAAPGAAPPALPAARRLPEMLGSPAPCKPHPRPGFCAPIGCGG